MCTYALCMRTHITTRAKSVKKSFQNSIRLLVVLLMMAGTLSAFAYDAASTAKDKATRVADVTTLTVQSGGNYIRIEPEHLPATVIYSSDSLFGPIPAALANGDTLPVERLFENCSMGWKWTLEEADETAIVEIVAHENALIHVDPYVCVVTYSDTTAVVCNGIEWNDTWYDESGDYEMWLKNAAGCDSVRTLRLTVFTPVDRDTVAEAWDSLLWHDEWYYVSGDYPLTMEDEHKCEFVYTLHLTIHATYRDTAYAEGCQSVEFEQKEYTAAGVYDLDTTMLPSADRAIRYVQIVLGKCPVDTTIYFCPGLSPAEWNYMEGVILDTEEGRTLVDLMRAEENLYNYYVAQKTPVKSIVWSFRAAGESIYQVFQAQEQPQWLEAGDVAITVRFLCGQAYYGGFSTRTQDLPMTETETQGRKILMNGQIVILRNGVRYTILGTKLD